MYISLGNVFVHTVVGDKSWVTCAVPRLGVKVLHVVADVGKQLRPALHGVLVSHSEISERGSKMGIVSFRAGKSILESEDQRRWRGLGVLCCPWRQSLPTCRGRRKNLQLRLWRLAKHRHR